VLKYLIVVYCTVYGGRALYSQSVHTLIGSRAQGLGYASACLTDEWSLFNNVAGLAGADRLSSGFTYEAHPSFKSFNRLAAVVNLPLKIGTLGAGVFRFGDELYNEHVISAGYANQFGLASLGIKVNYIQYRTEGFGSKGLFSFSFGGIATLAPQLSVGAHLTNVSQGKISSSENERLPTRVAVGFSFTPTTKLIINSEVEKDLDYDATWKGGIEYNPFKKFSFRTGFNVHPDALFFGTGFKPKNFTVDYGFQFQPELGSNHQATVIYHFHNPTK
jgi:hypothetical protein